MGILGFILMIILIAFGLIQTTQLGYYVDIGRAIVTVVVTVGALMMSYGSCLGSAVKASFSRESDAQTLKLAVAVFKRGRSYAVVSGALGSVVGMVIMLKNLDDPSALGPGLAMCLLTLLYGLALAYLVLLPVVGSLRRRIEAGEETASAD